MIVWLFFLATLNLSTNLTHLQLQSFGKYVWNNRQETKIIVCFCWRSFALDCVYYDTLGKKLLEIGIRDRAHLLIKPYLHNRKQSFSMQNITGDKKLIIKGFPKSSSLVEYNFQTTSILSIYCNKTGVATCNYMQMMVLLYIELEASMNR